MNDTPATVTKELVDAYKAAPVPIQRLILSDKFAAFTNGLGTKFSLTPEVAASVADELLLFLLGSMPTDELLGTLLEIDALDEGIAVEILEAFSTEIVAPLQGGAPTTPKPSAPASRPAPITKPVAPPIAPINRLQGVSKPLPQQKPAGTMMDIHPLEKHLELPPHITQTKAPPLPPKPPSRPYVPPPSPMRTMGSDIAGSKQGIVPPPKPVTPIVPKVVLPPAPSKPPTPPASDAPKASSDPYREPIT